MELGVSSLLDFLGRNSLSTLGWKERMVLAHGVAAGVEFLHSQSPQIIHLDLKSPNVVLDGLMTPKVCECVGGCFHLVFTLLVVCFRADLGV